MRQHFVRIGIVAALGSLALAAAAQTTRPPLVDVLSGEAKSAYVSARILFNNNDFTGALTKYSQAYELSREPRLLYDMAICEKNLRHYARMRAALVRYQKEAGDTLAGDEKQIVEDALAAITNLVGAVRVTVNEADASVSVDGEASGTTPLPQALVLDLGKHKVSVTKAGFATAEKEVDIAGGRDVTVAITLSPRAHGSRLLVSADPEATVSIDGKVVAVGRFEGAEEPGPHEVSVTETGMKPYKAEIDLRDGERRTLQVSLQAEKTGAAPTWPWIVGGAALAAGAAVGGYLLFKPSDTTKPIPQGTFASVNFSSFRF